MEYINVETVAGIEQETVYDFKSFPWQYYLFGCKESKKRDNDLKTNVHYLEIPCAFDIETTNMCARDEYGRLDSDVFRPYSFMYHWQFCMGKFVLFGRTWGEFQRLLQNLSDRLHLSDDRRLVIYCHNLSFEFEHFKRFVYVRNGFFKDERKPLYVVLSGGIEFRDSLALSNMSLAKFCENEGAKHYKLVDTYDYSKIRTQNTELTEEEKAYCYNDVAGLSECIASRMKENTLANMPLTATGYVRRDFRNAVRKNPENRDKFIESKLDEHLYELCRYAFRGGDTHANPALTNQVLHNVHSFDIASSYPYAMVMGDFPIGAFFRITNKNFMSGKTREEYCHILKICIEHPRYIGKCGIPYISISKIENRIDVEDRIADNGRLLCTRAGVRVMLTVTDIDFDIIKEEYAYDNLFISDVWASKKGKLNDEFRAQVLHYFRQKTLLKNDDLHVYEYNKSKNRINSAYGMMVMRLDHDVIRYDQETGEYITETLPIQESLNKYYKSRNNFLSYQHGVWVTAIARARLRKMLNIVGHDVVYCDTDSVKFLNEKHIAEFQAENIQLMKDARAAGAVATDRNGVEHFLGVWEYEGVYEEFKTLGAKKYIVRKNGQYHSTIAGVSKKAGHQFFNAHGIDAFRNGTIIDNSGHLVAFYNDDDVHEIVVNGCRMITASNIALIDDTYTIGLTGEYLEVLRRAIDNSSDMEYI